jgi:hypothetical protein
MTKTVKVVYDWFGPKGPLINNYAPNILSLGAAMDTIRVNDLHSYFDPIVAKEVFSNIPGYEFAPSFNLTEDDTFVYEYLCNWRQSVGDMCMPGYGLIEQSGIRRNMPFILHGKGYILLENTAEAFVDHHWFSTMHSYFKYHHIPMNKIIYQTGCANAEDVYKEWADANNVPESNRMNVIFFDWVDYCISQKLKQRNYTPINKTFDTIDKDFLCFNRRYREHRSNLFMLFYKNSLLEKSLFSMPARDPDNLSKKWIEYVDRRFPRNNNVTEEDLQTLQSFLPMRFDRIADTNEMIQDDEDQLNDYFSRTLISVVTETHYKSNVISTTEKSFKPIKYKHPFILVGAYRSLEYLKRLGYKTFDQFWDESYDQIQNDDERMLAIVNLCKTISEWSREQKQQLFNDSRAIVDHNYAILQDKHPNNMSSKFWHDLRDRS